MKFWLDVYDKSKNPENENYGLTNLLLKKLLLTR